MKILFVINALTFGGAEKQVVVDANELSRFRHSVTVAYKYDGELRRLLRDGVRLYRIRHQNMALAAAQLFVHLCTERYDIVHCHLVWAALIGSLPSLLSNHRFIINEHGLGLWRKWHHRLAMRCASMLACGVVNSCDAVARIRKDRENIRPEKLVTIYNSYSDGGTDARMSHEHACRSNNTRFTVGFIGRFGAVKRVHVFLDIAERLREKGANFRIVLVGDGEERTGLEREIVRRDLTDYFTLPGFVLDTGRYLNAFDVFVLPSIREGFPVVLLEAGAAGVPAIAYDVGGNSEIVQDGRTGYIVPDGNVDRLVDRVLRLYANRAQRASIGSNARRYVRHRFSSARRVRKLLAYYKRKCSGN